MTSDKQSAANAKFASHVTQVAFNLNLSRNMVWILDQICRADYQVPADDPNYYSDWPTLDMRKHGMRDTAVGGMRSLVARGLIYAPNHDFPGICVPTEAGRHVHALLALAGLVPKLAANSKGEAA